MRPTRDAVRTFCWAFFASTLIAGCSQAPGGPVSVTPASGPSLRARITPHWTRVSLGTFADPYGVAVNPTCSANCDVFVADPGAKKIWKITPGGSTISVGDFSAAGGSFDPQGVAVDANGAVYVVDKSRRAFIIDLSGKTTVIGGFSGPCIDSNYFWRGIAVGPAPGKTGVYTYVAAPTFHPLLYKGCVLTNDGKIVYQRGNPYAVTVDRAGTVFIADAAAKSVWQIGTGFLQHKTFEDPYGIAVTWDGSWLYVADAGAKELWASKSPFGVWDMVATFADPYGVAVDGAGNVYVADPGSKEVYKLIRFR